LSSAGHVAQINELQKNERISFMKKLSIYLRFFSKVLLATIFIMIMLLPRRPNTSTGWIVYFLIIAFFVSCAYAGIYAIEWLQRQEKYSFISKLIAIFVAISAGGGFIFFIFYEKEFIATNFY
jgi:hypothetical protein